MFFECVATSSKCVGVRTSGAVSGSCIFCYAKNASVSRVCVLKCSGGGFDIYLQCSTGIIDTVTFSAQGETEPVRWGVDKTAITVRSINTTSGILFDIQWNTKQQDTVDMKYLVASGICAAMYFSLGSLHKANAISYLHIIDSSCSSVMFHFYDGGVTFSECVFCRAGKFSYSTRRSVNLVFNNCSSTELESSFTQIQSYSSMEITNQPFFCKGRTSIFTALMSETSSTVLLILQILFLQ